MDFRLTYDASVDAAYLYLAPAKSGIDFTHPCDDEDEAGLAGEVMLDVGRDRKLVGIEFLRASELLPEELLALAERDPN